MNKLLLIMIFPLIALTSFSLYAEDTRHIHINGEHLDNPAMLDLDRITGGIVPNGYYWLNLQTGQWGFEGNNEVKGIISSIANYNNAQDNNEYATQSNNTPKDKYNAWEGVSGTGSVTSGRVNGQDCTYVSVGGMTMKSCD